MHNLTFPTEWKIINKIWHQKIEWRPNGTPKLTYYYKVKSGKSRRVIEIRTKLTKQLSSYMLICKDLRDCQNFLNEYKIAKNSKNDVLLKCIMRAIIITYAKCFVSGHGRTRLTKKDLPNNLKDTHDFIMKIRHEYIAHSGKSSHERSVYVLLLPPKAKTMQGKKTIPTTVNELYNTITYEGFSEDISNLIQKLYNTNNTKRERLLEKIESEVLSLDPQKIYSFCNSKKSRRIKITQNDINKMA